MSATCFERDAGRHPRDRGPPAAELLSSTPSTQGAQSFHSSSEEPSGCVLRTNPGLMSGMSIIVGK